MMWKTDSFWVEISVVTFIFLLGHIYLGHFEERSPKWRKLLKYFVTLAVILSISGYFGRTVAMTVLGLSLIPVIYIHGVVLPGKGINGWTGEPKSRYYEFRGWDKNIFGHDKKEK
jgi:hypothetical protein